MLQFARHVPVSRLAGVGALLVIAVAFLSNTSASGATIVTVDQQQTVGVGFAASIPNNSPIGQSFTPTLSGLDAVELLLGDVSGSGGASVFVRIRDGSISGAILGTSATVSVPDGTNNTIFHFDFAATVPLTPSNLYVIEAVGAGHNPVWQGSNANPYPGGDGILNGSYTGGIDFYFREGLHTVPEPSALSLAALGMAGLGMLRGKMWRRNKRWREIFSQTGRISSEAGPA